LAYQYLSDEASDIALALFKLNAELYPESANAWDSLGEGYYKIRDWELAISAYRKSLSLDPRNQNAQHMLEEIESEIKK
jgi:tetratricopeptide (TPR) repeat protein